MLLVDAKHVFEHFDMCKIVIFFLEVNGHITGSQQKIIFNFRLFNTYLSFRYNLCHLYLTVFFCLVMAFPFQPDGQIKTFVKLKWSKCLSIRTIQIHIRVKFTQCWIPILYHPHQSKNRNSKHDYVCN